MASLITASLSQLEGKMVSFITIDATDADVSFGSKADISECPSDVRFTPKSGRLRQGAATEWQSNLRLLS